MNSTMEAKQNEQNSALNPTDPQPQTLSKNAQKKLLKQQKYEAKKAFKKELRKERMGKRSEERGQKIQRLTQAKKTGQNIVVDLEFSHLMTHSEIHSLVQQIMYCYAVNGRCSVPSHLWLTGCQGEMETQLQRLPGFDKWIIEKEKQSYVEAFSERKDDLVYLTADSETVLHELDPTKVYIVGGLVDRNRWKDIEILKFLETKDWKDSFFQVIPQRKRTESGESEICQEGGEEIEEEVKESETKKRCLGSAFS
ncbi:hypothetical protein F3Y22_tig00117000pilonHSYRG00203 [Hibiscus syriacus]|uniref:tRNA (guanine(9)-N(1))-methyltransferase n=1 Tax=Hibiscus syriacus TaxID=106335 RepID=A0A6A2WDN1_HIBSY|nr:hypothetical protein F3Y22_tig00117000pilonHSYRG00203 [Hibiscus syriacus]